VMVVSNAFVKCYFPDEEPIERNECHKRAHITRPAA
jgi:hypothetical protein